MNKTLSQKFHHILQLQKPSSSALQQNLPMISLNQLESKMNLFKRKNKQKQNLIDEVTNHQEINVCSPFYDRMKTHKQNCKCPYHRKQRLTLVPVRHTDKSPLFRGQQIQRNTTYQKGDFARNNRRNESYLFKKSSGHMNKQTTEGAYPYSHTQPINLHQKATSHDYSYEQFMKDCDFFMLNKKGFSLGKSNHVIRKGVKEIFQFINKHLDYTVQKMTAWVNSVEKDKDYGEFYVERFKEMKINHEMNKNKHGNKTATTSSFAHLMNRTHKLNSKKPKFSNSTSNLSQLQPNRYKKSTRRNLSSKESSERQCASSSQHTSSDYDSDDSEVSLDKIVSQLKLKHKISEKTSERIMKKGLDSFKQLFEDLQTNIMNEKYSDDLLQKFDSDFLQSLLKKYSNNKSIKHIQTKIEIITKTHETLKKYRAKKSSDSLSKTNPNEAFTNSKGFIGSKRNTQTGENNKTSNSFHSHSKKYSDLCSLEDIKDPNDNFNAIEEDDDQIDEEGANGHKNGKNLNHGNVRRSKLLKEDQFNLDQIRASNLSNSDYMDRDFDRQKQKSHTGFFTKAQKFLFDVNMGKAIVSKEDSIFTMKRKVRVMKALLKENLNSNEANQLKEYIKAIEHKIYVKTHHNKQKATKLSSTELMSDEEIWRLISLDNLGFNLIFYNLTSKINAQENDDLCILLNEIKINGIKKFENHVTYKTNFKLEQQDVQTTKKNTRKTKVQEEDIFVQEGMGNMQFEPQIQSESSKELKKTHRSTKRTKTIVQNFKDLAKLLKSAQINESSGFNFDMEEMDDDIDDIEVQMNYQNIKKMLKYAKMHLPETFEKYLKNTSIYNASQMNSFIES